MRFTLYPIYWLSDEVDDEQSDLNKLPCDITENVRIEKISHRFGEHAFDFGRERLGTGILDELEAVRYALVHRYEPGEQSRSQGLNFGSNLVPTKGRKTGVFSV